MIKQDYDLLERCKDAWEAREDFRERRMRARNYYRGTPSEMVVDPDTGRLMSEEEYIESQGRVPYRMNRIRPAILALKGQYRNNPVNRIAYGRNREDNEAGEQMTEALNAVIDMNMLDQVDADQFEELLIGGMYGWKIRYAWVPRFNREDVLIDVLDPMRLFFNEDVKDRRLFDLKFIGEIHDISYDEVYSMFGKTKKMQKFIEDYFSYQANGYQYTDGTTGFDRADNVSFDLPTDTDKCRLIEVWKQEYRWQTFVHDPMTGDYEVVDKTDLEQVHQLNLLREAEALAMGLPKPEPLVAEERYEPVWKCYFLTTDGHILYESDTPYWHEEHPYILGFGAFLDGEIWGVVEDVIDPQRLINRLTIAIDYMFGASAKGVLLIPEESIPQDMSVQDFASEWSKFNGVIKFKAKPGAPVPQQVTANAIPYGLFNWLQSMNDNIESISGVHGAMQGITPPSGTPNALYQSQIMQGNLLNKDFYDSFNFVRRQRDLKVCKLIAQYYNDYRKLSTGGKRITGREFINYDPQRVRSIDWDIVMSESADAPANRQLMEEYLVNLMATNRITFRQYLEVSSHPKAEAILALIGRTNPALAGQQMDPQAVQQLTMQAQAGDPDAMAYLNQLQ